MNIEIKNYYWVDVEDLLDNKENEITQLSFNDGNGNLLIINLTHKHLKQMLKDIYEITNIKDYLKGCEK